MTKPPEERRGVYTIRLSADERAIIDAVAQSENIPTSELIRELVMPECMRRLAVAAVQKAKKK